MEPTNTTTYSRETDEACSRRKKTRRGKKRYGHFSSEVLVEDIAGCGCNHNDHISKRQQGNKQCSMARSKARKFKHSLRPSSSPKAPHNSTQFLIDDHIRSKDPIDLPVKSVQCGQSAWSVGNLHETDSFYNDSSCYLMDSDQCLSPSSTKFNGTLSPDFNPADMCKSINRDEDQMMAFLEQDFEQVYREFKEQELASKDQNELLFGVQRLVSNASKLQGLVQNRNPHETQLDLASLQTELKSLKEQNEQLTKENKQLKCIV